MSVLNRGPWVEVELRNHPNELVMMHPGWTNDRDSLFLPLRETGWFSTTAEARDAYERTELWWGWVGADDDRQLVPCTATGQTGADGECVDEVSQVTLAQVPVLPGH